MSVFVIRHADKEQGSFYGESLPLNDQPLSETGRTRASGLVPFFTGLDISTILVSEYVRTKETIDPVSRHKGIQVISDRRLNEINIGDTDNLTDGEIESRYPEFWKDYLARTGDFRFPNGESGEEAGSRIYELFSSLDPAQNHILVSHDGVIRTLVCKVLSLPSYRRHLFRIDLCSISVFEYSTEFSCWTMPKLNMILD